MTVSPGTEQLSKKASIVTKLLAHPDARGLATTLSWALAEPKSGDSMQRCRFAIDASPANLLQCRNLCWVAVVQARRFRRQGQRLQPEIVLTEPQKIPCIYDAIREHDVHQRDCPFREALVVRIRRRYRRWYLAGSEPLGCWHTPRRQAAQCGRSPRSD